MDGWKCKLAPRLGGGGGGDDDKSQWGIYPVSYRGKRRRWMVLSAASSGMVRKGSSFGVGRRCDARVCPAKARHVDR
jgi:hypothetical protein